jgi:hypothetical protein
VAGETRGERAALAAIRSGRPQGTLRVPVMSGALPATRTMAGTALLRALDGHARRRRRITRPERYQDPYRHDSAQQPHYINVTQGHAVYPGTYSAACVRLTSTLWPIESSHILCVV